MLPDSHYLIEVRAFNGAGLGPPGEHCEMFTKRPRKTKYSVSKRCKIYTNGCGLEKFVFVRSTTRSTQDVALHQLDRNVAVRVVGPHPVRLVWEFLLPSLLQGVCTVRCKFMI